MNSQRRGRSDTGRTVVRRWRPKFETLETRLALAGDLELLQDIETTPVSYGADAIVALNVNDVVFATNVGHSVELWSTMMDQPSSQIAEFSSFKLIGKLGRRALFTASVDGATTGLWSTDGTPVGTVLIQEDVNADTSISAQQVGNHLYFLASESQSFGQPILWVTDGTEAGTLRLTDSAPSLLTPVGDSLFFVAAGGSTGHELWVSDGTLAGTRLVKDVFPGELPSNPQSLTVLDGVVYFSAESSFRNRELWRSDGTEAGTTMVIDLHPTGSAAPTWLAVVGDSLYFNAFRASEGRELWKTDGTAAGTVLVKDIRSGTVGSAPRQLTDVGGKLIFTADDGVHGRELWTSDGTPEGTQLLVDIVPQGGVQSEFSMLVWQDKLYFGEQGDANTQGVWTTDGTASGTVRLSSTVPDRFVETDDRLYFSGFEATTGNELWTTDGTPSGTRLVADLWQGNDSGSPQHLTSAGNQLFFSASIGATENVVMKTDGSLLGLQTVARVADSTAGSGARVWGVLPKRILISVSDPTPPWRTAQLWSSDGTTAGTQHLLDVDSSLSPLVAVGDKGVFLASRSSLEDSIAKLYQTDGTPQGTRLMVDLGLLGLSLSESPQLWKLGNQVVFTAYEPTTGQELWITDGTAAGTRLVRDITPGAAGTIFGPSYLPDFLPTEDKLYFVADDGTHGAEVWVTDGTAEGTSLLRDVNPTPLSFEPFGLTQAGSYVYYGQYNGSGFALIASQGTSNTTTELLTDSSPLIPLAAVGNQLWFTRNSQLWTTDGTLAGTRMLMETTLPVTERVVLNNLVLYEDQGLWSTDGTSQGTVKLIDAPVNFDRPAVSNGVLYLLATNPAGLNELWKSDGTQEGTTRVLTFAGDPNREFPGGLTPALGKLFLNRTDARYGSELFFVDESPLVVTNLMDYAPGQPHIAGSLRRMLEKAEAREGADTISFAARLSGGIILQDQLEVRAGNDVTIQGPRWRSVTLSGNKLHRVMYVNSAQVNLSHLTIADGLATDFPDVPATVAGLPVSVESAAAIASGGGLLNISGNVTLQSMIFENNQTGAVPSAENPLGRSYVGLGGAIGNFFEGGLAVSDSRFVNNAAIALGIAAGGAIDTDSLSTTRIVGSSFSNNLSQALLGGVTEIVNPNDPTTFQGSALGGAVKVSGASTMTIVQSTFDHNAAIAGSGTPGLAPRGGFTAGGGAIVSQALSLFVGVVPNQPTRTSIASSTVTDNLAQGGHGISGAAGGHAGGGAIVNWGASQLLVSSSYIADNTVRGGQGGSGSLENPNAGSGGSAYGGAIDTGASAFGIPLTQIVGTLFTGNRALAGNAGAPAPGGVHGAGGLALGGALANSADLLFERLGLGTLALGELDVTLSAFTDNLAEGGAGAAGGQGLGGAIGNQASLRLRRTAMTSNQARGGSGTATGEGLGGGIYSDPTIGDVDIDFLSRLLTRRNRATTNGGNLFGL